MQVISFFLKKHKHQNKKKPQYKKKNPAKILTKLIMYYVELF